MATAAAVLAACGGGGGVTRVEPHATVPTAPPTTADPYAIPPTIDAAYVNRVLEGLDAAVGDVVRMIISTRQISPEVIDRLNALYLNRDDANLFLQGIQDTMRNGFSTFKENPGDEKSSVVAMISGSQTCVFAKLSRDFGAVTTRQGNAPLVEWIGLKQASPRGDLSRFNPTPWMIATEGVVLPGGTEPPNPCAGSPS